MWVFILWLLFALLVGKYASGKGQSGALFFLLAIVLSPLIGFIIALISSDKRESNALRSGVYRKCPLCAEIIKSEAIRCKHCNASVEKDQMFIDNQYAQKSSKTYYDPKYSKRNCTKCNYSIPAGKVVCPSCQDLQDV